MRATSPRLPMRFWIGAATLALGCGPLLFILAAAEIGLWPDPDPNPIGPGLLAGLTIWPGLALLASGLARRGRMG